MDNKKVFLNDKYGHEIIDDTRIGLGNTIKGKVQIYDKIDNELVKIDDEPNLVLYIGREWLAQRAANETCSGFHNDLKNGYLNWFGIGTNGASPGDILTPLRPTIDQETLLSPIVLNASESSYLNLTQGGNDYQLKEIGNKSFVKDIVNDNRYLIFQAQTTIISTDANGPSGSTYYDINEAGLYIGDETGTPDTISIFARCTFSTIRKDISREIVFVWNIYF